MSFEQQSGLSRSESFGVQVNNGGSSSPSTSTEETPAAPLPPQQPTSSAAVGTEGLDITIQAFKNAETLSALWRIWFDGLPGYHPVCKLDRVHGVKNWRGTSSLSKFYQRRQKVIKRMEIFMRSGNYNESNQNEAIKIYKIEINI